MPEILIVRIMGVRYSDDHCFCFFETLRYFFQDLANHLVGLKQTYVKLTFLTTHDLTKVRKDLLSAVRRNKERQKTSTAYADMLAESIQVRVFSFFNPESIQVRTSSFII